MITIIKSGCWKVMNLFYKEKTARYHFREIARKTKLHEPSTTQILKLLEKEQILKSEKDGNLKKYFIKKNKKTYLFFEIFDIEKFEKLPNLRKNAIKYYISKLKEKPIFIIVFGSTAKETYKEESDIDLLLIANKKIETLEAEKEAEALTGKHISSFQITINNFEKELKMKKEPVIQAAITTGYPITNIIYYYEMIFNEY